MLELSVIKGVDLPAATRDAIITMCTRAYAEEMQKYIDLLESPTHILAYVEGELASHAMWVTRWLQVSEGSLLRTAYIEAVATDPPFQRRGYATAVMERISDEIQGYELGALGPSDAAFYERLGWELWQGPLYIRTDGGLLPTPDEEIMIYRLPATPPDLDRTAPLSAEWRAGEELW